MFCSKEANNEMENYRKGHPRFLHDDFTSSYDDLRMEDNSATIHVRNLQFLMTEIFKTIHDENSPFMKEIFVMEESCYNLRSKFRLYFPRASTTKYGMETSFRCSQIWNALPNDFKDSECVSSFKRKIKTWNGSGQAVNATYVGNWYLKCWF